MSEEKYKISVRLNGNKQSYEEVTSKREVRNKEEKRESVTVHPEFTHHPPNIIDFGERRKVKIEEQPYWDDGNHDNIPKLPYKKRKKKKRKVPVKKISVKKLPITVIIASVSAIIVGISLGFIVLNLVPDSEGNNTSISNSTVPVATEGTHLKDLQVNIVQGGAFSTYEKGKEMAERFQNRGQAAVLASNTENYYLFIGLGTSRNGASGISDIYENDGVDTYVKAHGVSGMVSGLNETETSYINQGVSLYEELTVASVQAFTATPENVGSIIEEVNKWNSNQVVIDGLEQETKEKVVEFASHIKQASEHLSQYEQNNSEGSLWSAQQKLLEGLIAYEQLIAYLR